MGCITEKDVPFIRAILASPRDNTTRLAYADWLDEHGKAAKAEYLRLFVALQIPGNTDARNREIGNRMVELCPDIPMHWRVLVKTYHPRDLDAHGCSTADQKVTDTDLGYGPCYLCGRSTNYPGRVSRLSCERCDRVFCWECADTGVHGSLADFEHFVTGAFSRPGYGLGRDSCPFCQESDWMTAHGG